VLFESGRWHFSDGDHRGVAIVAFEVNLRSFRDWICPSTDVFKPWTLGIGTVFVDYGTGKPAAILPRLFSRP